MLFYLHDPLSSIQLKFNSYNSRRQKQVQVPQVNTTRYGLKSFRYEATRIWNSLPNDIRTAESFKDFQRLLQVWDGSLCSCSISTT